MTTARRVHSMLALLLVVPCCAKSAEPPPPPQAMSVQKIKDNVYMIKGGVGANTGLIVGDKDATVIDAKMTAESAKQMIEEVKKITPNPISRVILTHSDRDHVNGLAGFPKGLAIVAQEQCKVEMDEAFKDAALQDLREYLPTQTYGDKLDLKVGALEVRLLHYGPAHTSGDTIVLLPSEKVAFIGDLAFASREPLVHRHKGGIAAGCIETLKNLIALDAETYIAGHDEPLKKADLKRLQTEMEEKLAKVKALVAEGKSLADVKAALGVVDPPAKAGGPRFPSLAEVIYRELTEEKK